MILITSGAYIADEFASEVGILPPAFLPIGNKRLFEHQHHLLKYLEGDIYISIPEHYQIDPADAFILKRLNIEVIRAPENINLGSSILYCWNCTGRIYEKLTILHGDTLLSEVVSNSDVITVHKNNGYYQRAKIAHNKNGKIEIKHLWASTDELVISGYFSFQKPQLLMQGIVKNNYSFTQAIAHYTAKENLAEISHGQWFDFGHLNSFFRSRSEITTQRAFNEMEISARIVEKRSQNTSKMNAEAEWFESLPNELKIFTPALLAVTKENSTTLGYKLEYLYLLPLSDIFVFGNLSVGAWKQILSAIFDVLTCFKAHSKPIVTPNLLKSMDALYLKKTIDRLDLFQKQSKFDIHKPLSVTNSQFEALSLVAVATECSRAIQSTDKDMISIVHGDLCFSNMLYDSRIQSLKLIDPRGIDTEGNLTIYGDARYDLAKLYHSIVGLYDLIIAGRYNLHIDPITGSYDLVIFAPRQQQEIEKLFLSLVLEKTGFNHREILAITILLFISMLPLHYDMPDRQKAMIANALRLYQKFKNLGKA